MKSLVCAAALTMAVCSSTAFAQGTMGQGVGGDSPVTKPKGGQFVLQVKAPHDNPFDCHTLRS